MATRYLDDGTIEIDRYAAMEDKGMAVAKLWFENAHRNNKKNLHGEPDHGEMDRKLDGAITEGYWASITDLPWNITTETRRPDVGEDVAVRSTRVSAGHLLVFEYESDDTRFVFCVVRPKVIHYKGWLWGIEARDMVYWNKQPDKNRPCFWVPQSALRPTQTIKEIAQKACMAKVPQL